MDDKSGSKQSGICNRKAVVTLVVACTLSGVSSQRTTLHYERKIMNFNFSYSPEWQLKLDFMILERQRSDLVTS